MRLVAKYIDNKKFESLIIEFCSGQHHNSEELMELFDKLITNIINSFNFKVEMDDAKQECYLLILKILKNFDPSQGSAFNYFTTIILNNLKLISTKNRKYKDRINAYIDHKFGHQAPSSL